MSNFRIEFSNPWWLLLLIPALFFSLFPHFRIAKRFRRTRNRIISVVMHTLAMVLCILLIAGISFHYDVPNKNNELLLVVDMSESNTEKDEQKDEFIQAVIDACDKNTKLGIVTFGYDAVYAAPLTRDARDAYAQYKQASLPDISATNIAEALNFAAERFENPKSGKIVLLSDGLETDEYALSAVKFVTAKGIMVDTVDFSEERETEVQIIGAEMPTDQVLLGQEVKITLTLQCNYSGKQNVGVTLYDMGFASDIRYFNLPSGTNTVELTHIFSVAGVHDMCFEVSCAPEDHIDTETKNNKYYSYMNIAVFENVLMLESKAGEADTLVELYGEEFNVTVKNVYSDGDTMPQTLKELCEYEQVVLVNISNQDLTNGSMPDGFDRMLYDYVYEIGGSLFTVGGENDVDPDGRPRPHAYNREDMDKTLFQDMLPVQVVDYTPSIAVILVVDTSASMMWDDRLQYALKGAEECLDALTDRDYCGVVAFGSYSEEKIPIIPVAQKEKVRTAIRQLMDTEGGGTVFGTALDRAGRTLASVPVERKHIILITDGEPSDHLKELGPNDTQSYGKYVDYNYQNGITLSVLTVGMEGNRQDMYETAERGHGHFYDVPVDQLGNGVVGMHMREDIAMASVEELATGLEFAPKVKDHTAALLGVDSTMEIPVLNGYYGTKIKTDAKIPLIHDYVPIYAEWDFGEGRVGSFMSDLGGAWSKTFVQDEVGRLLVKNIAYSLAPTKELEPDKLSVLYRETNDNYSNRLDVYTVLGEGETVSVTVMPVSQEAISFYANGVPVTASGDNVSFGYEIKYPGLYNVLIEKKDANANVVADLSFYHSFSYSEEYNKFYEDGAGTALLAQLSGDGHGNVIVDPVEIFTTFAKFFAKAVDPRLAFLIMAIIFVLIDIAVRKFKFKWIHEIIRDRKQTKELMGQSGKGGQAT